MNTTSITNALALIFISQAIMAEFKPIHRIWYALDFKPWPPSGPPAYLVPLTCAPCFAFWSTAIATAINRTNCGILADIGIAAFSYLASKVIHKLIK